MIHWLILGTTSLAITALHDRNITPKKVAVAYALGPIALVVALVVIASKVMKS
jgi:hypothetical protein